MSRAALEQVGMLLDYLDDTIVPELRELRPGGSMQDGLAAMVKQARAALSAPEASANEIARLRAIEHHAWHVLDESCERDGEVRIYTGHDYDCLLALLPEDHPQHDTEHTMNFGNALDLLKSGHRVARSGWNGKGMWLALQTPDEHSKMRKPYIYMRPVDGEFVPWLASQTDMLAEDWEIVQ